MFHKVSLSLFLTLDITLFCSFYTGIMLMNTNLFFLIEASSSIHQLKPLTHPMFNQVTTSSASFSTTPYVLQNLLAISQTISALPQASFPSVILPLTLQSHTSTSPTRKIFPNLPYSPPCITPIPSQRECLPPSIIHTTFSVLNKLYYS